MRWSGYQSGNGPIYAAAAGGRSEVVSYLVRNGADVNINNGLVRGFKVARDARKPNKQ